jgi:hypothetical protein
MAIERFGGFVANCPGDGVIAYFGFPEAHEKRCRTCDPRRRSLRPAPIASTGYASVTGNSCQDGGFTDRLCNSSVRIRFGATTVSQIPVTIAE